jgi:hypothetical protein
MRFLRSTFAKTAIFTASFFCTSTTWAINCKSVTGSFDVDVNHCVAGATGCMTATVTEMLNGSTAAATCTKIRSNGIALTGCIANLVPNASSSHTFSLALPSGPRTLQLVTRCDDDGVPTDKTLMNVGVQVLTSAPVGNFSNIDCALTGGATTCSSEFQSQPPTSNMRWSCLWAKTQANQTVPDRLLQCFNTSQSSSWTYVYDGVTAAPQTIELRGWGGVLEPALGTFSAIANPLLKSKIVSASTAPLVTGRFVEPCIASASTPCISYISNAVSGNVQIAWQSNFTGALDIKRFVNSNSANPTFGNFAP